MTLKFNLQKSLLVIAALAVCYITSVFAAPSIKFTPDVLLHGNEEITVTWDGIEQPDVTDAMYITMTVPKGKPDGKDKIMPIGYYPMKTISTYETGAGSISFKLYHPRQYTYNFNYVRFEKKMHEQIYPEGRFNMEELATHFRDSKYHVIVSSESLKAADQTTPHQIHLALTHDPTEMLISYTHGPGIDNIYEQEIIAGKTLSQRRNIDLRTVGLSVIEENVVDYQLQDTTRQHTEYEILYSTYDFSNIPYSDLLIANSKETDQFLWNRAGTSPTIRNSGIAVRRAKLNTKDPIKTTYTLEEMCGAPATDPSLYFSPGIFRQALLTDLVPGKKYFYTLRGKSSDEIVPPRTYSFYAAPVPYNAATDSNSVADFFAFGDLGVSMDFYSPYDQQPAARHTLNGITRILDQRERDGTSRPTMVLLIGDISYARGHVDHWEHFFAMLEPVTTRVPWMVTMGNHDTLDPTNIFITKTYANDAGGECGLPAYRYFTMPTDFLPTPYDDQTTIIPMPEHQKVPEIGSPDDQAVSVAYSFDYGPVHFTVFSAEHDFTKDSRQYKFVEEDLKSVDRSKTPWVILTSHRPLYCSTMGCGLPNRDSTGLDDPLRVIYEPLMIKYNVDVGLWGHIHAYERTCGIIGNFECGEVDEDGPVHVIVGMAGHPYNNNWINIMEKNPDVELSYKLHHEQPKWSVFRTMNFGFTHVHADKDVFRLRYINNQRGTIHDELVLTQERKKKSLYEKEQRILAEKLAKYEL